MAQHLGAQPVSGRETGIDLCLHPPGCCPLGSICSAVTAIQPLPEKTTPAEKQQRLTIFYCGRMCAVDVTEGQAQVILRLAYREERQLQSVPGSSKSCGDQPQYRRSGQDGVKMAHPVAESFTEESGFLGGRVLGQSMTRSLQRFLEKRSGRLGEANVSPYSNTAKAYSASP